MRIHGSTASASGTAPIAGQSPEKSQVTGAAESLPADLLSAQSASTGPRVRTAVSPGSLDPSARKGLEAILGSIRKGEIADGSEAYWRSLEALASICEVRITVHSGVELYEIAADRPRWPLIRLERTQEAGGVVYETTQAPAIKSSDMMQVLKRALIVLGRKEGRYSSGILRERIAAYVEQYWSGALASPAIDRAEPASTEGAPDSTLRPVDRLIRQLRHVASRHALPAMAGAATGGIISLVTHGPLAQLAASFGLAAIPARMAYDFASSPAVDPRAQRIIRDLSLTGIQKALVIDYFAAYAGTALPRSSELYYRSADHSELFVVSCRNREQAVRMQDVLRRRDYKLDSDLLVKQGINFFQWSEATGVIKGFDSRRPDSHDVARLTCTEHGLVTDEQPWSYLNSTPGERVVAGSDVTESSDCAQQAQGQQGMRRRHLASTGERRHRPIERVAAIPPAVRPEVVYNSIERTELFREQVRNLPSGAVRRVERVIDFIHAGRVPTKIVSLRGQRFIVDDVTNLGMRGRGQWRLIVEKTGEHIYRIVGIGDYHRDSRRGAAALTWWSPKRE